ncbi:hypothetical protein KHA90_11800 [Flavobacterium psychroterrae]|uniref:Uncharacterized protein n=1 Tax=Flavobacterium psychroterrae TaxID=2133767 RepID=A0ABS5PCW3_9FLAO|nr:hypothetical protein [Flavobacterium psychroterrae]MBS7231710.1 hypothetical protein [Flavobacterium psychroterrae]
MNDKEKFLEVEYIDGEGRPVTLKMFDGTKISIGKNVQDFYFKLLELPVSHRCQILNLDINELQKFIKEHTKFYNEKLISEFNKVWLWTLTDDLCDFHDKEINNELFEVALNKKQIIGKLKRNTFDTFEVFKMLDFFKNHDEIKEHYLE